VLRFPSKLVDEMIAHCLDGYPLEACGLLAGTTEIAGKAEDSGLAAVTLLFPTRNVAESARVYEVDARDMLRADRAAESAGGQLIGVFHSHTHTDAKPSPTDIAQAPDPAWHYVLVSLRDISPSVRSWAIRDGRALEEPVVLQ
jgi:[CysO sulfur-carrier protein]-S-L-cysteine hydrolase